VVNARISYLNPGFFIPPISEFAAIYCFLSIFLVYCGGMIVGPGYFNDNDDRSALYKAWRKYYSHLSFTKQLTVVERKVRKGKMPSPKP
jgi:hypothetical protein